jgi:hypothetical protein
VAFDIDIKHWPTLDAFATYLQGVPRPAWCRGITNHNTYVPNETQWRGLASMRSMQATYIGKGWSAGPHLYLAAEAPNPADRGVWQMTPLSHVGVHAGPCNKDHLGIENVGDFDARPPTPAQYQLLIGVNLAILRAWMLTPDKVVVHKECMPGRTCPGRHLDPNRLRADLTRGTPRPPVVRRFVALVPVPVFEARDPAAHVALNNQAVINAGDVFEVDDVTAGWAHVASGLGFVTIGALKEQL